MEYLGFCFCSFLKREGVVGRRCCGIGSMWCGELLQAIRGKSCSGRKRCRWNEGRQTGTGELPASQCSETQPLAMLCWCYTPSGDLLWVLRPSCVPCEGPSSLCAVMTPWLMKWHRNPTGVVRYITVCSMAALTCEEVKAGVCMSLGPLRCPWHGLTLVSWRTSLRLWWQRPVLAADWFGVRIYGFCVGFKRTPRGRGKSNITHHLCFFLKILADVITKKTKLFC